MGARSASDLRLRLPGFRRYARDIARLEAQSEELAAMRARVAAAEDELARLRGRRGLGATDSLDEPQWAERAKRFEYYWLNADKKIDLLAMRPFGPTATRVLEEGRTFLNADRLYTLWQAATAMPDEAAAVAEVGVFKGGSARLVAEALLAAGRPMPFFACDTFDGHTVVNEALDGRHRVGKQFRSKGGSLAPRVRKYLARYDFVEVLEGDIQHTAGRFADQHRFGMVHIDVDVHPITQFCLEFFAPRVVVGGTMVIDDYGFTTCGGVKVAVDEFAAAHRDRFWKMHLLTGQAVITRLR
jgi:O-methyltransferase